MRLVDSVSFAQQDCGGHADCHGDVCSLLHWKWLCEVCPEGSPFSSPDISPDPAEDPGIALFMWFLCDISVVNAHTAVG